MRRDMHKVIVERPRRFGFGLPVRKGRKPRDIEDLPFQESKGRPYLVRGRGWKVKEQTDNLQPLRRYLLKQVGRPWNKVYSEICANARMDSTMQRHLRFHVLELVKTDIPLGKDDKPKALRSAYAPTYYWPLFYVDPRTGLLRVTKQRSRR